MNRLILFVLTPAALLWLASCQSPVVLSSPQGSSVSVSASEEGTRSVLPASMAISRYTASGSGPSGATTGTQTSSTGSFTFSDLASGSWTFTVNGLQGSTTVLSGSTTITVSTGARQSASIHLLPASGTGTLSLTANWSSGKPVTAVVGTLTPEGTSTPTTLNFTVSGTSATYGGSLASGSYTLLVTVKNGTTAVSSTMESVLVYPGQTSSWTASVSDAQFVSSEKDIGIFGLTLPDGTKQLGSMAGTSISVVVPSGTVVTSLVPTVTTTGASVSPGSGVAQDFTNPVTFTVTAADGSTKVYTVTVTKDIPTDGLLVELRFNGGFENTGSAAISNTTNSGTTFAGDRFGNANSAGSFSNSFLQLTPTVAPFSGNSPRTYAAWIYKIGSQPGNVVSYGSGTGANQRFSMLISGGFNVAVIGQYNDFSTTAQMINPGEWVFVCVTHDGTTTTIYKNGSAVKTNSSSYSTSGSLPLLIGKNTSDRNDEYFTGRIDDLRVYNRALSPEEINSLYHDNN